MYVTGSPRSCRSWWRRHWGAGSPASSARRRWWSCVGSFRDGWSRADRGCGEHGQQHVVVHHMGDVDVVDSLRRDDQAVHDDGRCDLEEEPDGVGVQGLAAGRPPAGTVERWRSPCRPAGRTAWRRRARGRCASRRRRRSAARGPAGRWPGPSAGPRRAGRPAGCPRRASLWGPALGSGPRRSSGQPRTGTGAPGVSRARLPASPPRGTRRRGPLPH